MGIIEDLVNEHREIERIMDGLEGYADRVAAGEDVPREDLAGFVAAIQGFADAAHHAKEEDILFVAMQEVGFDRHQGPVAMMLLQHDQGRAHVARLAALTEGPGAFGARERDEAHAAAYDFTGLLRGHIEIEDSVLYPMAKAQLPADRWAELDARGKAADARLAEKTNPLRTRAQALIARYGR